MKKKVLLVVESSAGGVGRHVLDLLRYLDQDKYQIFLLYGTERIDDAFNKGLLMIKEKAEFSNIKYIAFDLLVREISLITEMKAIWRMKQIIKSIDPDIIHCHSSKAGIIGRLAGKVSGVKQIYYTPHAYSFQAQEFSELKKKSFIYIEKFMSKFTTSLTLNVSNGERAIAQKYKIDKADKLKVIHNGIPDISLPTKTESRKILNLSEKKYIIGVTARMNDQKDPITFVKIAKEICLKYDNVQFVYIGDGPLMPDIKQYIEENNLQDKVLLYGFRSDAEVLVTAFDLYLLTSLYEGFPYSLIEALRAGVPIVATKTIGNEELVKDQNEKNGELFTIEHVNEGVQAVEKVMRSDLYTPEICRRVFLENFSVEKMVKSIENIYFQNSKEG